MGKFLTHKEIENLCDQFMEKSGWARARETLLENGARVEIFADRIYMKKNRVPLLFEIKPENALTNELKRGIGQLACCLPYQLKLYLVLSEKQWHTFDGFFEFLPWLGAVVYDSDRSFEIRKESIIKNVEERGRITLQARKTPKKKRPGKEKYVFHVVEVPHGTARNELEQEEF